METCLLPSNPPDFPVFTAMLKQALGNRIDQDSASFVALLAEDVEIEHPYAPAGQPKKMAGRQSLSTHIENTLSLFTIDDAATRHVYRSDDRGAVIVEFSISGRILGTNTPFQQNCISIVETSNGLITRYCEYYSPSASGNDT